MQRIKSYLGGIMERDKKYKGDFVPKYKNSQEIYSDTTLLPVVKVRELVKHYSMALFGLATDMASAEQALKDKETAHEATKQQNVELRAKVKELENYASPDIKSELPHLRQTITLLRQKNKKLLSELNSIRQKKRIDNLTNEERQAIQADYYEKRIKSLTYQVSSWREKYQKLLERIENG